MRKSAFIYLFLPFLFSNQVLACGAHLSFDPDQYGFFGSALIRLAGLAPPKPVITLEHPPTLKVDLAQESEISIDYKRPWRSNDVNIELTSTPNIELIDKTVALSKLNGTVSIRFRLTKPGYNTITLAINGEHKGKTIKQQSKIFVGAAKKKVPATDKHHVALEPLNHPTINPS